MGDSLNEATVLHIEERGEQSVYIVVFCPDSGLVNIIKRVSASRKTLLPDIFDDISAELNSAKSGALKFMGDFESSLKRTGIGRSYECLSHASAIAECAIKNGRNVENLQRFSAAIKRALNALDKFDAPAAARLKFMYLFARDEGYPVREDFYAKLPDNEKQIFSFIIKTPSARLSEFNSSAAIFVAKIEQWISSNTDIIVPDVI